MSKLKQLLFGSETRGEKKAKQGGPQKDTPFGKKWPLEKQEFEAAKKTPDELRSLGGGVKRFYKRQNELVDAFFSVDNHLKRLDPNEPHDKDTQEPLVADNQDENSRKVKIAIYGSFCVNVLLFCMKIYASIVSGSLSVIASALV